MYCRYVKVHGFSRESFRGFKNFKFEKNPKLGAWVPVSMHKSPFRAVWNVEGCLWGFCEAPQGAKLVAALVAMFSKSISVDKNELFILSLRR